MYTKMFSTFFSETDSPPPMDDVVFEFEKHIVQTASYLPLQPFLFLNRASVDILNSILDSHEEQFKRSNHRTACFLRGLGYVSSFIKSLGDHPDVLDYLSLLTGISLIPHYLFSNIGHVNIGTSSQNQNVDDWHYDSVPYVLIILLTSPTEFDGGHLEYVKDDGILRITFPEAGYALFMKGSEIRHRVTRVTRGCRRTIIFSYMDRHERKDTTRLETFENDTFFNKELAYGKQKWNDIIEK